MSLYLLHWDEPLEGGQHPQHYLGWTKDGNVEKRYRQHITNGAHAARIVVAAVAAGRTVEIAAQWAGERDEERRLKAKKRGFKAMCPLCKARENATT